MASLAAKSSLSGAKSYPFLVAMFQPTAIDGARWFVWAISSLSSISRLKICEARITCHVGHAEPQCPLHKSFVTRESDWPMAAMFLSYAFGRNIGLLWNVIRCQAPSLALSWGSVQRVQPVRQCSSTRRTSTTVGCWPFSPGL